MTDPKHKRILNRIIWRSRLKTLLQLAGILLMIVGVIFVFPSVYHPGKTTIFRWIVNLGTFSKPALFLIVAGVIAIAASWFIQGDLYEEP